MRCFSYFIFTDGRFCSPNVTESQYITLTASNETNQNPSIQSPNYPNPYPNNIDCVWVIIAPPGKKIKIRLTFVWLENQDSRCAADYVELGSGLYSYTGRLGRYCFWFPPFAEYSTGRYMWVKFHSDQKSTRTGFSASYEAVDHKEKDHSKFMAVWYT